MHQEAILYPVFVMVLLSLLVGLRLLQLRFRAVSRDNLPAVYFKLNRGGKPPAYLVQVEQNYANLFETPVLYYVIVILIYVLQMTSIWTVTLAWAYVVSRFIHSYVHLGGNQLFYRRNSFLLGIAIITIMWITAFISLLSQ